MGHLRGLGFSVLDEILNLGGLGLISSSLWGGFEWLLLFFLGIGIDFDVLILARLLFNRRNYLKLLLSRYSLYNFLFNFLYGSNFLIVYFSH